MLKAFHFLILAGMVALGQAGCGGSHNDGHTHAAPHHHDPPHGGTGVTLGDEEAHIEFLADAAVGTVTAWFFSPHMERYLRIKAESFEVLAKLPGGDARLTFLAVANAGTGETVGNTSQFVAGADWLSNVESFDAVLPEVTVGGRIYRNVAFNYPKGN
ncbi:MAG TPA: hypothetical protein QGG93_05315 [Verrucomicrobiota bacterium]|nr:hypothetical protein [Verrucomicrobiota bacterium]